jgi:ribonuclease HII
MVVGIDEVGRGCWAGPLVAAAVVLNEPIAGLKDSKVLTKLQRAQLSRVIYEQAAAIGLGWVSAREVDALGLTEAVRVAMQRAMAHIEVAYDEVIIDGNYNFLPNVPAAHAVVKADGSIPVVSAASIIAKVARDDWMTDQATREFPQYGFDKHVGYGTKLHMDMLKLHGVCSLHRLSYKPIQRLL